MDLNVNALIGATYLIPIAITLRKVYAPSFDLPDAFALAIARLDTRLAGGHGAPDADLPRRIRAADRS